MTRREYTLVRELLKQCRRQIRHHGHLCGYGNFPRKSKHNECSYCTAANKAIKSVALALARSATQPEGAAVKK
jgi:hypothetical protein